MYNQIDQYKGETGPQPMKEPELVRFFAQFQKENSYMASMVMEAKDCVSKIYRWSEPMTGADKLKDSQPPSDLTSELNYQLECMRLQNAELASLVRHIRQIIG
jgi:hypothetical protein